MKRTVGNINRNIRCFEISLDELDFVKVKINRNIRCFEICSNAYTGGQIY